jgi:hypothetical protein
VCWASGEINSAKAGQQLNKLLFSFLESGPIFGSTGARIWRRIVKSSQEKKKLFYFILFFSFSFLPKGRMPQSKETKSLVNFPAPARSSSTSRHEKPCAILHQQPPMWLLFEPCHHHSRDLSAQLLLLLLES